MTWAAVASRIEALLPRLQGTLLFEEEAKKRDNLMLLLQAVISRGYALDDELTRAEALVASLEQTLPKEDTG